MYGKIIEEEEQKILYIKLESGEIVLNKTGWLSLIHNELELPNTIRTYFRLEPINTVDDAAACGGGGSVDNDNDNHPKLLMIVKRPIMVINPYNWTMKVIVMVVEEAKAEAAEVKEKVVAVKVVKEEEKEKSVVERVEEGEEDKKKEMDVGAGVDFVLWMINNL